MLGYSENAAQGQWQYSSNNGSSWQTLASVGSAASARTVASSDLLRFLPAANFFGTTPALTIALVDSSTSVTTGATINAATRGGSTAFSEATATLTQQITGVSDIGADNYTIDEDTVLNADVFANDNFGNVNPTATLNEGPSFGSLQWDGDGNFIYTPNANFSGEDSFAYTVSSGGVSESATVEITITSINDAPLADRQQPTRCH